MPHTPLGCLAGHHGCGAALAGCLLRGLEEGARPPEPAGLAARRAGAAAAGAVVGVGAQQALDHAGLRLDQHDQRILHRGHTIAATLLPDGNR